jgi:hypothetical protein
MSRVRMLRALASHRVNRRSIRNMSCYEAILAGTQISL